MLTSLRIQHFTIVEELELDFFSGMTVFTGETGAGKSILIDALVLALGGRADASVIRPGNENCDIQAHFVYSAHTPLKEWLQTHGIDTDTEEIILRRVITQEGRSKAYVNGITFPLQKIKELSEFLVHIHGQHEHQTLLNPTTHRQHLDAFAQHENLRQEVSDAYGLCQALDAERQALASFDKGEWETLSLQHTELQQLAPTTQEIEQLYTEQHMLQHSKDYLERIQNIATCIDTDEELTIQRQLQRIQHELTALPQDNPRVASARALFENVHILCDEAMHDLNAFAQDIIPNPERLAEVETRMSALHHFARKYRVDVRELQQHEAALEQKLQHFQQVQHNKTTLEQRYQAAQDAYYNAALKLRASRQQHADALATQITANIQQLGMPHGFVHIHMTPLDNMSPHGIDKVEYHVSTNPGMQPGGLSKIVSGGELSRISLAIQMLAAQQGAAPTLIFDEVDVGIGGSTAAIVGQLLRQLGQHHQVGCVTHQPQVAASAHQHYQVKKTTDQQRTFSHITRLTETAHKVEEIARMLGGLSITDHTRSHAQELLASLGSDLKENLHTQHSKIGLSNDTIHIRPRIVRQ